MTKNSTTSNSVGELIIEINRSLCISCGSCVALAPNTFEQDKNLISQVKSNPSGDKKSIIEAAKNCPTEAITIIDKKTRKIIWPK